MSDSPIQHPKSPIQIGVMAARLKTLAAAVAPVVVGTAMALEAGAWHLPSALLALGAAIFVQIGTNLHNDYRDFERGADTEGRKGPTRVTQAGLVSPRVMRRATLLVFGAACACGLMLLGRGGWPVLAVGAASVLCALAYSAGGRFGLADRGLADLAVLVFFGPVAVGGTYYVQALALPPRVTAAGLGPGLLSVAILLVNNVRDVDEDRAAGKRTLVVRMGRRAGAWLYAACITGAALVPVVLWGATGDHAWAMTASLVLPLAWPALRTMHQRRRDADALNALLGTTGRLLAFYGLAFSIGWNV